MKILEALFYRIYCVQFKNGLDSFAPYMSVLIISFLLFVHMMSINNLFYALTGNLLITLPKWGYLGLLIFLNAFLYLILLWKQKDKKVIERYASESIDPYRRGITVMTIFSAFTVSIYVFSLFLMIMRNRGYL